MNIKQDEVTIQETNFVEICFQVINDKLLRSKEFKRKISLSDKKKIYFLKL